MAHPAARPARRPERHRGGGPRAAYLSHVHAARVGSRGGPAGSEQRPAVDDSCLRGCRISRARGRAARAPRCRAGDESRHDAQGACRRRGNLAAGLPLARAARDRRGGAGFRGAAQRRCDAPVHWMERRPRLGGPRVRVPGARADALPGCARRAAALGARDGRRRIARRARAHDVAARRDGRHGSHGRGGSRRLRCRARARRRVPGAKGALDRAHPRAARGSSSAGAR